MEYGDTSEDSYRQLILDLWGMRVWPINIISTPHNLGMAGETHTIREKSAEPKTCTLERSV